MLTFILIWIFLLINCLVCGSGIVIFLSKNTLRAAVDSFFLSIWVGFSFFLWLLMAVSLLVPLSPVTGFSVIILPSVLCLAIQKDLIKITQVHCSWIWGKRLLILSLIFLVAIFMNQKIEWFDTGLYHLGLTNWIAIRCCSRSCSD